jgi:hypothetical protein
MGAHHHTRTVLLLFSISLFNQKKIITIFSVYPILVIFCGRVFVTMSFIFLNVAHIIL